MRVRIPADAATGSIVVEVRDRGHATSARPFTVTRPAHVTAPPPPPSHPTPPPPTAPVEPIVIQGFSPRTGPPGSMVQLLGDGFGTNPADIRVWIGAIEARVVSITGRMLTIQVPPTAQTAPLRIMRRPGPSGGASAQTPVPFTVSR
jgi:hypothetical protein